MKKLLLIILSVLTLCSLTLGLTACGGEQGDVKAFTLHTDIEMEKYDSFNALKTIDGTASYIKWKSSNKKVCIVENGELQAVGAGTATITATAGDIKAETNVVVIDNNKYPVFSIDQEDVTLRIEDKITVNGHMTFNSKAKLGEYSFSSDDESVATVNDKGVITAVKEGQTIINVIGKYHDYSALKKINVKVIKDALLELNSYDVKIEMGKIGGETFSVIPTAYLNNQIVTANNYSFVSLNPEIATIDINGVIRGVKEGNTTITVSAMIDGSEFTATIAVSVVKNSVDINIQEFEAYVAVNGNVKVPNEIEINLADYGVSPADVTNAKATYVQGAKTGNVSNSNITYNADKTVCKISGRQFGSETYGDNVVITYVTNTLTFNINIGTVVTKFISTKADLENIIAYGNGNSQTAGIPYNGYFVMTNNIDLNGTISRREPNVDYKHPTSDIDNTDYTAGFKGVFDGRGYSLYNYTHYANKGGLFGNVSKDGVIKNLGIVNATYVPVEGDMRIGLFGSDVTGTITNCYIDVEVGVNTVLTLNPVKWGVIGRILAKSVITDVVIKLDLTNRGNTTFVSLGAMLNNWPNAWTDKAVFTGIYVFTTEEIEIASYASSNANGYYVNVEDVWHFGYNEAYNAPINDMTYWAKGTSQPIFISAQG